MKETAELSNESLDLFPDGFTDIKRWMYIERRGSINVWAESQWIVKEFIGETVWLLD